METVASTHVGWLLYMYSVYCTSQIFITLVGCQLLKGELMNKLTYYDESQLTFSQSSHSQNKKLCQSKHSNENIFNYM